MTKISTYVGIDAHKKDLFIAMLIGTETTPVTWTVPNEPNAVRRLVRRLERRALAEYVSHYHAERNHQELENELSHYYRSAA